MLMLLAHGLKIWLANIWFDAIALEKEIQWICLAVYINMTSNKWPLINKSVFELCVQLICSEWFSTKRDSLWVIYWNARSADQFKNRNTIGFVRRGSVVLSAVASFQTVLIGAATMDKVTGNIASNIEVTIISNLILILTYVLLEIY